MRHSLNCSHRLSPLTLYPAVLHTIFFHRYFTALTPSTHDLFDLTLPLVTDPDLSTLINARANSLARLFDSASDAARSSLGVTFSERSRRRKGWFQAGGDDDAVWEVWRIEVVLASPRTDEEVVKARRAMEASLLAAVRKIVDLVNKERSHIPPITTNESNPFPFQILVNERRGEGWGRGGGIF